MWAYAKLGVKPPHMLLVVLWDSVGIGAAAAAGAGGSGSGAFSSSYGGSYGSSSGSVGARLSAFKPQELAMLVWALAVLKLVPGELWGVVWGTGRHTTTISAAAVVQPRQQQQCVSSLGLSWAAPASASVLC